MGSIGKQAEKYKEFMVEEAKISPDIIGNSTFNITRPKLKECLPACKTQENHLTFSEAQYPPDPFLFFFKKEFCTTASHLYQETCKNEQRRHLVTIYYPHLCDVLEDYSKAFNKVSTCKNWPWSFFKNGFGWQNQTLEREVTHYAKGNLIYVIYFIQSPYMTLIKRDIEMTLTDFVSNTGGLLGLFLGFSVISLFELIFWACKCMPWLSAPKRSRKTLEMSS